MKRASCCTGPSADAPGAVIPLSLPPDVSNCLANGNINWRATVTEDNASLRSATHNLPIGDFCDDPNDTDCDGIVNGLDIGPLKAPFGAAPGPSALVP